MLSFIYFFNKNTASILFIIINFINERDNSIPADS